MNEYLNRFLSEVSMRTLGLLVSFGLTSIGVFVFIRQSLAVRRRRAEERSVQVETNYATGLDMLESQDIETGLKEEMHGLDAVAHHVSTAVEQALHGLHVS
jgi:hypothetical protein